jgi:hypothetical protein
MCTTCGCSDTQVVRTTMPGAPAHTADGHTQSAHAMTAILQAEPTAQVA